jgi:hypothetical protein
MVGRKATSVFVPIELPGLLTMIRRVVLISLKVISTAL